MRIGLIVNPSAGMGGRVALKGSDGPAAERAVALGAVPIAGERASRFLGRLAKACGAFDLITIGGAMGGDAAKAAAHAATVLPVVVGQPTDARDTMHAARALEAAGVDLIVFVGGDGTARDVLAAIGTRVLTLGIPSGVKMQSAVFATSPEAGAVLVAALASRTGMIASHDAEVMDIDESALSEGTIAARLHGYLRVPQAPLLVQPGKARGPSSSARVGGAAREIASAMTPGTLYLIGPGTSMRLVKGALGFDGTLLGVDAVRDSRVVGLDVTERQILALAGDAKLRIILGIIGGQGFLLGRGNQQLSPEIIRRAGGLEGLIVLASTEKLLALEGRPLLVDTGDPALDSALAGYVRITTGPGEATVVRIAAPPARDWA
ncbi:MAG: NAD(+)/NADH kinase [Hyphomicrobiaceae bacterium]